MPEKEKTALLDAYKQRKAVMQKSVIMKLIKLKSAQKGRLTIWHTRIRSQHIAQLTKTR